MNMTPQQEKPANATSAANSTKATGGSAVAAYVPRALTLGTVAVAARDAVVSRPTLDFFAPTAGGAL